MFAVPYIRLIWDSGTLQIVTISSGLLSQKLVHKTSYKLRFYGQVEAYRVRRKTVILVCKFLFQIQILFATPPPPTLLLVHRIVVFFINFFIYKFLLTKNP